MQNLDYFEILTIKRLVLMEIKDYSDMLVNSDSPDRVEYHQNRLDDLKVLLSKLSD